MISLSPSITRQIIDLGGADILAGVTSYDDYRSGVDVVGTLVQPNIEKIIALKPDLVVYSEEDSLVQSTDQIAAAGIATRRFKKNRNFSDICENYIDLGALLGKGSLAAAKAGAYKKRRLHLRAEARRSRSGGDKKNARAGPAAPLVAILVSHRPLMAVSENSYIGGIIGDAGGRCAYGGVERPFPLVSFESLVELDPDVIISITHEWDDFGKRLKDFPQLKCVMKKRIYSLSPDGMSSFTPADYLKSVEMISAILRDCGGARPGF